MGREKARTLEAYSIHGHVEPGTERESLLAYADFFRALAQADVQLLRYRVAEDTVAVVDKAQHPSGLAFRFVTGNADDLALIYDAATGRVEPVQTGDGRFIVRGAWVVVDPDARVMVVERKRPGVPVFQLERFLSQFGREHLGLDALKIVLNPMPSPSFAHEVQSLTRIREASITLRRPNHSWTRSAQGLLGQLGASNAGEVQVQLNAERGESLAKDSGIVREIIDLAHKPVSALKNATVRGTSPVYEGERTVSLQRHTVKGTARVDPSARPGEQLEQMSLVVEDLFDRSRGGALDSVRGRGLEADHRERVDE